MDLSQHSDEDLLSNVAKLVGSQRALTARLVAHLAEIEDRRLHLVTGFSSMFDFCQKKLGMGEGEAFRRILAARLTRRFPAVCSLVATGSVSLSTLQLLRDHLTEQNHAELFAAVAGKSKLDVQVILAARFPRPNRPSRIRREARIEPLSEVCFKVEFTASDELRKKLELCRDLMSHANPSRELGVVIERAVDLLLADLEKRRLGRVTRPRRASVPSRGSPSKGQKHSHIANATRRAVFERDGLRCSYVGEGGRRCEARAFLELDHVEAKALGGSGDASNLRVLCRAHNQLRAEQTFGRERVEEKRSLRQKKSAAFGIASGVSQTVPSERGATSVTGSWNLRQEKSTALSVARGVSGIAPSELEGALATTVNYEKIRSALRAMGFRDAQARRAVAAVARRHDPSEDLPLEQALREAIWVAAAA